MLVGITGNAGAGKDTVGEYLANRYHYQRYAFAAPIKGMITKLLFESDWGNREWKETPILCGKSPRELAQTLGTEWGRDCVGENVWCEITMKKAMFSRSSGFSVAITDVRFENEADAIRKAGGVILALHRPTDTEHTAHASESGLEPNIKDYFIENNRTIEDLYDEVENFLLWYRISRVA